MRAVRVIMPFLLLASAASVFPVGCMGGCGTGSIPPSLELVTPTAEEPWVRGATVEIQWDSRGTGAIRVELSRDGGTTWEILGESGSGWYGWTVAGELTDSAIVRVTDLGDTGLSSTSDVFGIVDPGVYVTRPAAGDVLAVGKLTDVSWSVDGATLAGITDVRVELSRDDGASWTDLAPSVDSSLGSWPWPVDDGSLPLPQRLCRIRISDVAAPASADTSGNFAVFTGGWCVDPTVAPGGDGLEWATAFSDAQTAIDGARPGEMVWLKAGVYTPDAGDLEFMLKMKDAVSLYGGFAGTETAVDQRGGGPTVLDGEASVYHVLGAASDAMLDGVTITGGDNTGFDWDGIYDYSEGAGLYGNVTGFVVVNCAFESNAAKNTGGGAYLWTEGTVTFERCTFSQNTANYGAAARVYGGAVLFENCVFTGNANVATYASSGVCVVRNCTFSGNSGLESCGAIDASYECELTVVNSVLWQNPSSDGTQIRTDPFLEPSVTYSIVEGGFPGAGNLDTDPLFVDAGTGDLRLSAGSPCIDAGSAAEAPTVDRDCVLRGDDPGMADGEGAAPVLADIGAYEFVGTTPGTFLVLVSPEAGNSWRVGESAEVRWTGSPDIVTVEVLLSRNGGATWETLAPGEANDRVCSVSVTSGGQPLPQTDCLVRVRDEGGSGVEDTANVVIFSGVRYVNAAAPLGGDGLTWATAHRHPQDAADAAVQGDEIWVSAGIYVRRDSADDRILSIRERLSLYGGFDGTETARVQRNWSANVTVLDGEDVVPRVVETSSRTVLDGFTLTRGSAMGEGWPDTSGAALYAWGRSEVVVANCEISSNQSRYSGGAVFICRSAVTFSHCDFTGNTSGSWGGAIYAGSTRFVADACRFTGNSAEEGGAIWSQGTLTGSGGANCIFWGNHASEIGGALAGGSGKPIFMFCTLYGNSAGQWGGAMGGHSYSIAETVLQNCIVWGNGPTPIHKPSDPYWSYDYKVLCSDVQYGFPGSGNIDADPLFVNPAAGDLHLDPLSPCIDAGLTPADCPTEDIEGNPRRAGSDYDMGAYER
jgi:hypothetical protein